MDLREYLRIQSEPPTLVYWAVFLTGMYQGWRWWVLFPALAATYFIAALAWQIFLHMRGDK